jgi:hypothetical protein
MNNAAEEEQLIAEPEVDDPKTEIEDLVDHFKDYVNTGRELYALKLMHKIFSASASALVWGIVIFLGLIAFLFLSIGAALWVGSLLENNFLGFFIVAGFYGIVATVIYLGREKMIKKPFETKLIDHMLND